MRVNKTEQMGNLISKIGQRQNPQPRTIINSAIPLNKQALWKMFLQGYRELYGKNLIQNEEVINNLKVLFHYFLKDPAFFDCHNLIKKVSVPSFDKGLLIIGGYGIGKTAYLKVFEHVFKNFLNLKFKSFSSKELVASYEGFSTPLDKQQFFINMKRKLLFIDDLNAESVASNYGQKDVVGEILAERSANGLRTFATCNYSSDKRCIKATLEDLGLRYGERIYDRLYEMFNIIEFEGKSFRR